MTEKTSNSEPCMEEEKKEIQRKLAEQLAPKVGYSPEEIEKGVHQFIERSRASLGEYKGKPPYWRSSWYEDFFNILQERRIDNVSLDFIRHNIASGSEAYKFQSGIRFLGLVNEDGSPTPDLGKLHVTGQDFKRNLAEIIRQAYSDLFDTIIIDKAKPESIVNFIIEKYGYSRPRAEDATRLFVYFCSKADIPIPQELAQFQPRRKAEEERPTRLIRKAKIPPKDEAQLSQIRRDKSFATLEFDDFIFSVKKDLHAIEFARSQVNALLDYLKKKISEESGDKQL